MQGVFVYQSRTMHETHETHARQRNKTRIRLVADRDGCTVTAASPHTYTRAALVVRDTRRCAAAPSCVATLAAPAPVQPGPVAARAGGSPRRSPPPPPLLLLQI